MTGGIERRQDGERLARLEAHVEEIPRMRQRIHDMATSIAVVAAGMERNEEQHQVAAGQRSEMLVEIRALRSESAAQMRQHDERDDERFAAVGARLSAIEKHEAAYEAVEILEAQREERRHQHYSARFVALIGAVGAIVSALIIIGGEKLLTHPH